MEKYKKIAVLVITISVVLFAVMVYCIKYSKTEKELFRPSFTPITIKTEDAVFSVSLDGKNIIWCAGDSTDSDQTCNKIYCTSTDQIKPKLLIEKKNKNIQTMPAKMCGKYLCWIEYGQDPDESGQSWSMYVKKEGLQKKKIYSNKENPLFSFPNFTISDDFVVFDGFVPNGKDDYDSALYLYSLKEEKTMELLKLKGYDLLAPAIHKNNIVFCKLSITQNETINSKLCIYNIESKLVKELDITESGYQPSMNDDYIIFKEADSLYNFGKIVLYRLDVKTTEVLCSEEVGGDSPYLGENYAVWGIQTFDKIEGYDLRKKQKVIFEKGNTGKPYVKGNALVWIAEETPGKAVIKFLDL